MSDPHPTDGELAILRVLWSRKAAMTVREVHEVLQRTKDTAYTTVLKILTIMHGKGLVRRDESERSHRFVASYPEPVVQASLLKELMERAFGGSAVTLVQRALADDTASSAELDAIARLIAEAKAKKERR
jgi:BlaI family transcriptional regulator, penicillinase repressor